MPRPGRDRQLVAFRIARSGLAAIDAAAAKGSVTRSEMIRKLLAEALASRAPVDPTKIPPVRPAVTRI